MDGAWEQAVSFPSGSVPANNPTFTGTLTAQAITATGTANFEGPLDVSALGYQPSIQSYVGLPGSSQGAPGWYLIGTNGAWQQAIDQAAAIPYRDLAPAARYLANRTVNDAVTVSGSTTLTSATAAFVAGDATAGVNGLGRTVRGPGWPPGTRIASVTNGTTAITTLPAVSGGAGRYLELGANSDAVEDILYVGHGGAKNAYGGFGSSGSSAYRFTIAGANTSGALISEPTMGGLLIFMSSDNTSNPLHIATNGGVTLFNQDYLGNVNIGGPQLAVNPAAGGGDILVQVVSGSLGDIRILSGAGRYDIALQDTWHGGNLMFLPGGSDAHLLQMDANGVFYPTQAPTASAPAYVKGGMYFDTTLNKLRIGGGAGWETVTSA